MGSLPTQTIPWLFDSLIKSYGAFPTAGSMEETRSEIGRRPHLGISQAAGAAGCCEVLICVWGVLMGLGDQLLVSGISREGAGEGKQLLIPAGGRMLSSSPPEENHQRRRNHTYPVPNGI